MKSSLTVAAIVAVFCAATESSFARPVPKTAPSLAQLELTAEVAATTGEGYPAALRVTIKNVGSVPVDMPVLGPECADAGVKVMITWTASDASPFVRGSGGSCFRSLDPVVQQIEEYWIRLRPGEFMTTSLSLRDEIHGLGSGTVEYWVTYSPPPVEPKDAADALQAGYNIPTEKLQTEHWTFTLR
jgi:hypothetical protein